MKLVAHQWDETQRAEFLRRRRARQSLLLVALSGFCLMIFLITLVKLHAQSVAL